MKIKVAIIVAVTAAVAAAAWLWMHATVDSYDKRFEMCMNQAQITLYPQGHHWPDNVYNEAMQECERRAGAPQQDTGNPGSWEFKN